VLHLLHHRDLLGRLQAESVHEQGVLVYQVHADIGRVGGPDPGVRGLGLLEAQRADLLGGGPERRRRGLAARGVAVD
jgi:hypothetical protein